MQETREHWEQFKVREDVEIIISSPALTELSRCNTRKLSYLLNELSQLHYTKVQVADEERELADMYLQNGVLKEKSFDDLTHITTAALNGCHYIVSWNFRHFVNPKTINAVNSIHLTMRLPQVNIFSPSMMSGGF